MTHHDDATWRTVAAGRPGYATYRDTKPGNPNPWRRHTFDRAGGRAPSRPTAVSPFYRPRAVDLDPWPAPETRAAPIQTRPLRPAVPATASTPAAPAAPAPLPPDPETPGPQTTGRRQLDPGSPWRWLRANLPF